MALTYQSGEDIQIGDAGGGQPWCRSQLVGAKAVAVSLAVALFRFFGGTREFNPLGVFRQWRTVQTR